jgi:hypothetical protein
MMSKRFVKILLLILNLLPFIFSFLGITIVGLAKIHAGMFFTILGILTIISIPSLIVFYVIDVLRNASIVQNKKAAWVFFLIFMNVIVFPIYWYFHIWHERKNI